LSLISTSARRNSFQVASVSMMASAASAGTDKRQDDLAEEDRKLGSAIDAGRLDQLGRDLAEEAAEHQHLQRYAEGDIGRDQGEQGVGEPQVRAS
jgi:hypothetical protein